MLRKDAAAASALMLYRKKPNQMERAPPAFLAAPSAEASNEVRPPPVLLCPAKPKCFPPPDNSCTGLSGSPEGMLGKYVNLLASFKHFILLHRRWTTG